MVALIAWVVVCPAFGCRILQEGYYILLGSTTLKRYSSVPNSSLQFEGLILSLVSSECRNGKEHGKCNIIEEYIGTPARIHEHKHDDPTELDLQAARFRRKIHSKAQLLPQRSKYVKIWILPPLSNS